MSCPKWAAFSHAWYWSTGKEATYHNDILVASIHSCKTTTALLYSLYSSLFDSIYLIPDTNSWFWKNATPMGPRKEAKDSRKICERGVPENFYLAQPPYIYIYTFVCRFTSICYCIPLTCLRAYVLWIKFANGSEWVLFFAWKSAWQRRKFQVNTT